MSRLFFSRVASRPRAPTLQSPPSRPSLTVPALARGNRHLTSYPNYPRYPKFARSTPPSLSSEETVAKGKRKEGTGAGEGVAIHHDDSVDAPAPAPSPRRRSCSRPLRPLLGQRPPARRRGRPGLGRPCPRGGALGGRPRRDREGRRGGRRGVFFLGRRKRS